LLIDYKCETYEELLEKIFGGEIKLEIAKDISYNSDQMRMLATKNEFDRYRRMKLLLPLLTVIYFIISVR